MKKKRFEALPVEGMEQIGRVNTSLQPFIIRVVDEEGSGIPFEMVDFRRSDDGMGFFEHRDVETQQDGTAAAEYIPTEGGKFRVECFVGKDRAIAVPFTGMVEDGTGNMSKTRPSGRPRIPAHPCRDMPGLNPALVGNGDAATQAKFAYPPRGAAYPTGEMITSSPSSISPAPVAAETPFIKTKPMEPAPDLTGRDYDALDHRFFAAPDKDRASEIKRPSPRSRRVSATTAVLGAAAAMVFASLVAMGIAIAVESSLPRAERFATPTTPSTDATTDIITNK